MVMFALFRDLTATSDFDDTTRSDLLPDLREPMAERKNQKQKNFFVVSPIPNAFSTNLIQAKLNLNVNTVHWHTSVLVERKK